jgi:radical SAM superfamily enzyme YgiQ (UPF0313 family)
MGLMNKMKFLFVHAFGDFSLAYWCLRGAAKCNHMPSDWKCLNYVPGEMESHEAFRRALVSWEPDFVGYSCHFWSIEAFVEAARWVKILLPRARTVFGGPQVCSITIANHILTTHDQIDFVIRGAGEQPLADLLAAGATQNLDGIPGLSFRQKGGAVHNVLLGNPKWPRGPLFTADNPELSKELSNIFVVSYETLRGCRNHCSYCQYANAHLSLLDIDLVEKELGYLCGFQIPHLRICDSHFAGSAERAKQILRCLSRLNRGSSIKIFPDLEHVDLEYLSLAREAKVSITSIGVQTANPKALRAIERRGVDENIKKLELLLQYFPETPVDLIVGLPGDDLDGLKNTFKRVLDLGFGNVNVFRLAALPGTKIFENLPQSLGGGCPLLTSTGEILHSEAFPVSHSGDVAKLVHALNIAAALRRTRKTIDGELHILDRLLGISSMEIYEIHETMLHSGPGRFFADFGVILKRLVNAIGKETKITDSITIDLVHLLFESCRQKHIDCIIHVISGRPSPVIHLVVLLHDSRSIIVDLASPKLEEYNGIPSQGDFDLPGTAVIDVEELLHNGAVTGSGD